MPSRPRREIPGIKPLPDGRFQVDFVTKTGKRPRKIFSTLKEALRELARIEEDDGLQAGNKQRTESGKKQRISFAELVARSLDNSEGRVSSRTQKKNKYMTGIVLRELPELGSMPADQIDAEQIDTALKTIRKNRRLEGSTINRYRIAFSRVFTYARKRRIIAANPVKDVEPYLESKKRDRYLRDDEEILLRRVMADNYPEREAEFDLALYTGIRREEQFYLLWEDVDFDGRILTVWADISKTESHWVPLNTGAVAALRALQARSNGCARITRDEDTEEGYDHALDWFHGDGKKIVGVVKQAGIANFHWHDLRHTFASRLVMAGVPLPYVSQWLGHKSITMTMRYAHLAPDNQYVEIEKMMPTDDTRMTKTRRSFLKIVDSKKVNKP